MEETKRRGRPPKERKEKKMDVQEKEENGAAQGKEKEGEAKKVGAISPNLNVVVTATVLSPLKLDGKLYREKHIVVLDEESFINLEGKGIVERA